MPTFTVTEVVGDPREWSGKNDSKFVSDYVKVEGDERRFELVRKPESPRAKAGDVVDGTIETREHGGNTYYKLKRAGQAGGFGGGGKRDPATDRRITRQHSQDMGIETLKLAHLLGFAPEVTNVKDIVAAVKTLADVYDKDAYAAGERAA